MKETQAGMQRKAETRMSQRKVLITNPVASLRSFLKRGYILIPRVLENSGVCRINSSFLPKLVKLGLLQSRVQITAHSKFNFGILHF